MKEKQTAGFGKPFIVRSKTTIMITGDSYLVLTAPYMVSQLRQF